MEAAAVLAYLKTAVSKFAWRVFFRFELGTTVCWWPWYHSGSC